MKVAVAAIVEDPFGRILLTKRRDFEVWCLPGGMVDSKLRLLKQGMMEKEDPKGAVLREVFEETGLRVHVNDVVGISYKPNWMSGTLAMIFRCAVINGRLLKETEETIDADFFAAGELPEPIVMEHRIYINNSVGARQCFYRTFTLPRFDGRREDIYKMRDESGLSPAEFYKRFYEGQWEIPSEREGVLK